MHTSVGKVRGDKNIELASQEARRSTCVSPSCSVCSKERDVVVADEGVVYQAGTICQAQPPMEIGGSRDHHRLKSVATATSKPAEAG